MKLVLDKEAQTAAAALRIILDAYMDNGHDGSDALDVLGAVAGRFISETAPPSDHPLLLRSLLGRIAAVTGTEALQRERAGFGADTTPPLIRGDDA